MGIKNLHSFLRSKCPEIYKTVHLSEFSYRKIAIDISLYMFKYKTIFGDKWLDAFIKLIACLRKNEIHCVFIYDNGAPPEKMSEREERANKKQKLVDKIKNISSAIDLYFETGEPNEILMEIYSKNQPTKLTRLLTPARNEKIFDISIVEQYLEKVKKQVVNIDYSDHRYSIEECTRRRSKSFTQHTTHPCWIGFLCDWGPLSRYLLSRFLHRSLRHRRG